MFPSGSILWADCSDGCPLLADISLSPWTAFRPRLSFIGQSRTLMSVCLIRFT